VIGRIQEIVTRVKRNEQEGVIFPVVYDEAGHKLFDLTLLNSGGQRQFDTDKVITRYDSRIAMSILSDFILLGHDRVGSFALGSSKIDLWTMAVDAIANSVAEVVNQHAIPRLLRINGMGLENLPYLTYGDVAAVNLTELADFVQKLAASGVLVPDENLEAYLREVGNLPQSGAAT
jgi:phage gp29-like protein